MTTLGFKKPNQTKTNKTKKNPNPTHQPGFRQLYEHIFFIFKSFYYFIYIWEKKEQTTTSEFSMTFVLVEQVLFFFALKIINVLQKEKKLSASRSYTSFNRSLYLGTCLCFLKTKCCWSISIRMDNQGHITLLLPNLLCFTHSHSLHFQLLNPPLFSIKYS